MATLSKVEGVRFACQAPLRTSNYKPTHRSTTMYRYPCIALAIALLPALSHAQHGTVHYEHTVSVDFKLPDEVAAMKIEGLSASFAKMPKEFTTRKILTFNATSSLMKVDETTEDGAASAPGGEAVTVKSLGERGQVMFALSSRVPSGNRAAGVTFVDFDEATFTQQRDFRGRTFLVSGEQDALAWRLPGEERTMLGYHVIKATAMKDTVAVEAWFTPEIPVPGGPDLFGGLPGLILVLSIDEGREVYTAVELDLENVPEFEEPTKGRNVTQAEYDQIVADKLEELEKTRRGQGKFDVVIRRQ